VRGPSFFVLALLLAGGCRRDPAPPPLRVAAAADLAFAFEEIGKQLERDTGDRVVFSFGSTGLLARQVAEGAPFDVFAGADVSYVDSVIARGACRADSKALYARGRIVVFTRSGSTRAAKALTDLADPAFAKIAIANPEHAPYGRAAKQAMQRAGIWEAVAPRVVYGENVQQTLQYAQSGNAEAAIVALSLATVTPGDFVVVDAALHDPIDQALVVCGAGPDRRGRAFVSYVNSDAGRKVMRRFGFLLPGEASAGAAPAK
jgi:molybdate transport system substrate-binding protein